MRKLQSWLGHGGGALLLAMVMLAMATPRAAAEDTVMLNDGNMYTGLIIAETEETIEIETMIGTISTRLKIDRGRITGIVRGHRTWKPPAEASDPKAEEEPDGTGVMEIPIVGEFGSDILPISFRASLDYARRYQVEHIVLRINSPGGSVWAAREILQSMEEHRDAFHFHALVESAISAAIWPTFACETIHIAPRGEMGGAVAYRQAGGHVEVDAKMNSIFAAEIVTIAEALGHDGDVIRAMILMPSELYARSDGEAISLEGSRPMEPEAEFELIDGPGSVLTLTTNDATRLGVAMALGDPSIEGLVGTLAVDRPKVIDGGGLMERWSSQCEKRLELAKASAEKLRDAFAKAEATEDIDEAIAALLAFQREVPRFAKYSNEYLECYPMDESIDREQVADLTAKVREGIKELRRIKREGP